MEPDEKSGDPQDNKFDRVAEDSDIQNEILKTIEAKESAETDQDDESAEPDIQAALAALFYEPFPQKPFALVPEGGEKSPEATDYVIHKDIATEHQCVLIFDSIVDAFAVAEEYNQETGRKAEAIECDVYSLEEDRFWVKFYRSNGAIAMMSLPDYKSAIHFDQPYE